MQREDYATDLPKVAILLCTHQGQRFLPGQLDSFESQSFGNWEVWVSDDNSLDNTVSILESYKARWPNGRLSICNGPGKGFAANFLSLTCDLRIKADFYAYSDQDDIWKVNKLERAIKWLKTIPENVPALYCSRTLLVNSENEIIGRSPFFKKPPSFANALTQNIAGGNTMVFNNATRNLLVKAGKDTPAALHDWWTYLVVTGCGGQVFYDQQPSLRYRQHADNIIGSNAGWISRFARLHLHWHGQFQKLININIECLQRLQEDLTRENIRTLTRFSSARNAKLLPRINSFIRSGIYRQTLLGNLMLIFAAVFKKL